MGPDTSIPANPHLPPGTRSPSSFRLTPQLRHFSIRAANSRHLALLAAVVHAAGLAAVLLSPLSPLLHTALLMGVCASFAYTISVHALRIAPWAIREATHTTEGVWILRLVSGEERTGARLLATGFAGTRITVLNFRTGRFWTRSFVLSADAVDPDTVRRLRASLSPI